MKTSINKLVLLLVFTVLAISAWALVSEYSFTGVTGTYTEITGGTVLGTNANDQECFNAIPLGFTFTYNGADYTQISVMANGFLALGEVVTPNNLPISSTTNATNNVVSAFSRDLKSRDDGELSYLLSGTAPNQVFTVQWKNYRRSPTSCSNDILNFQIQLHQNGNKVIFAYGSFTAVDAVTAQTVQVGLRGDDNTDFNNRTTTTDWTATTAGTASNASCRINSTVYPPLGLVFTYSPPQQGTPPNPAQNPVPANNATNVAAGTNLSWVTGGGTVDGYKLYFGTNNPPTNLVNGTIQTGNVYDHPTDLLYSTTYYWKVVPFNAAGGDALDCPLWQFTTLADPTVTTFPYVQNFDDVTPNALPLGWSTINANGDGYTWETYAGNAQTDPNSVRIRYNQNEAMDDWLVAPPLNLTADTAYIVKFWYRANSATYPEALSVYWGNAGNAAGLTNLLFENTNIVNTDYQMGQGTITPTANGTYYLGFHGHSAMNMFYLYLDSVSIEENVDSMDPPTNLAAEVVNNAYVSLTWGAPGDTPPPPPGLNDSFETYADFSIAFDPWVLVDVDQSSTYGFSNYDWLNEYAAQAFMVFNPSATTPPITDLTAHSGAKMAACFAAVLPSNGGSGPNNDWMISPLITPTAGQFLNFYAKSYTAQYGLERFKVGISTTGATTPASFTIISGTNYIQPPVDWTLYSYDLSAYAGQSIRFGIQCISNDAFIFLVDDVTVGPVPTAREHFASVPATGIRDTGVPVPAPKTLNPPTREFLGYNVYRDGTLLTTITNTTTTAYEDHDVTVGTYSYTVTAVYTAGESVPAGPVTATILPPNNPPIDLTATVDGNDVTLNWTSPEAPQPGEWITWCQDVLGNGIGTNSAIIFDVAHRFTQDDLAAHQGGTVTQVKFVPNYADCVYTVKVWTGGSANNAGTLVSSQVVDAPTLGDWNLCVLNTPVPLPTTGDLYVGYEVNTQGDHPAGCDAGPHVDGKGNMMYFQGSWTTLTNLSPSLTYNWLIQTFVADGSTMKAVELTPIVEHKAITYAQGPLEVLYKEPARQSDRALAGFKVYRDGALIGTINDPGVTTYSDMDLPNGDYVYGVTAVYTTGESVPATVNVTVNVQLAEIIFQDGFETYDNFVNLFAPWTLLDVDQSTTYGFSGVDFPGSGGPMAYIIFNPSATTPPITSLTPHGGDKMAACFAAILPADGGSGPNNDWMITPHLHLGTNSAVKFYARSHMSQYIERFRVGVSMLPNIIPQGFQYVSPGDYVEVPAGWTEYVYDLSTYDNQNVWIGIRCVSNDAFVFYVDDFSVHSDGGYIITANEDPSIPALVTELKGNYPNPFNPRTTISYSVKDATPVTIGIYNVKGQLVKTLVNEDKAAGNHSITWDGIDDNNQPVSSGVYFYKMLAGKYSSTRKMILMK